MYEFEEGAFVFIFGRRQKELKRLIPGVSDKVLIQSLKDLEADHVLADRLQGGAAAR